MFEQLSGKGNKMYFSSLFLAESGDKGVRLKLRRALNFTGTYCLYVLEEFWRGVEITGAIADSREFCSGVAQTPVRVVENTTTTLWRKS